MHNAGEEPFKGVLGNFEALFYYDQYLQTCPVREQWGDWLPCSVSCGSGFQSRERLCDGVLCNDGRSSKQARTCNEQVCKLINSSVAIISISGADGK